MKTENLSHGEIITRSNEVKEKFKQKYSEEIELGGESLAEAINDAADNDIGALTCAGRMSIVSLMALLMDPDTQELRKKYRLTHGIGETLMQLEQLLYAIDEGKKIRRFLEFHSIDNMHPKRLERYYNEHVSEHA